MKRFHTVTLTILTTLAFAGTTSADIIGLNNLTGWLYNQGDGGNPADLPNADTIRLTNLGTGQRRSIFNQTRQSITQFNASFTYRAANASVFGCDYGAAFVVHNNPAGAGALGGSGGGMGFSGITSSAAITLELQNNASGYFTNGVIGSNGASVAPLSLPSGRNFDVAISYNGTILSESITDTVSNQTFTRNIPVNNLAATLGSPTAFVGFTASTTQGACSGNAADQYFSNFRFTEVPEPTTLSAMSALVLLALRRRA